MVDAAACLLYLSRVYHHLGHPGGVAREFARVLRTHGWLCIRNATRDRLDRFAYLQDFPAAVEVNRHRLPSQQDVIAMMHAHGFALRRHDVIEQPFAASFEAYYDKIRQRALSDLVALAGGLVSGPIIEPIDLFIFAKAG